MKKYYLYSDNNDLLINFLNEENIIFDMDTAADYCEYFIIYVNHSKLGMVRYFAKKNNISIRISQIPPGLHPMFFPSYKIFLYISPTGRKLKRIEKGYLKYLSSNPADPISESEYYYKYFSK